MHIQQTILNAVGALILLVGAAPSAHATPFQFIPMEVRPDAPQDDIQSGMAALEAGDLEEARADFTHASADNSDSPVPHLGLAEVAHRHGDTARTEADLKAALKADPKSADVQTAWGQFLVIQKRDQEAQSVFETAIGLAPKAITPRLALADLMVTRLDKPREAAELYQAVIALQPDLASAHIGFGIALALLDHPDAAYAEFTRAQKEAPTDPQPPYLLGKLQAARGFPDEAMTDFDRSISLKPAFIPALVGKADLMLAKQEYAAAISAYQGVLALAPHLVSALVNLGAAQQRTNDVDHAIASFHRAIELDPNQPIALNNLAWVAASRHDHLDEALSWAERAISLAPKDASFLDTLGWVYYARGQLQEAKTQFGRAFSLQSNPETAYHLGLVDSKLGDRAGAETAFRDALRMNANYQSAATALKALLQRQ